MPQSERTITLCPNPGQLDGDHELGLLPNVCFFCSQATSSPHIKLGDNTPQQDRRAVALNMLEQWRDAANRADSFIKQFDGQEDPYLSMRAEHLRDEIIFLMGVD